MAVVGLSAILGSGSGGSSSSTPTYDYVNLGATTRASSGLIRVAAANSTLIGVKSTGAGDLAALGCGSDELFVGSTAAYAGQFSSIRIYANTNIFLGTGSTSVVQVSSTRAYLLKGLNLATTSVKTGDYTIATGDCIVRVGTCGSAPTITLPATPAVGDIYIIKDTVGEAATRNITIDGNSTDTIDGSATFVMNANYQSVTLYANSTTSWSVI